MAQALDDGGALVSYGGMSLRPITLPAALLQVQNFFGGGGGLDVTGSIAQRFGLPGHARG